MLKIKEVYQQLEDCTDDIERIELLAILSSEFLNTDINRCQEVVDQLGELAKKLNNPKAFGYYYSSLGRIYFRQTKYREAEQSFNWAIGYAQEAKAPMLESNCYHSLGMVFWNEGQYEQSLEVSKKALVFFEATNDQSGNKAMCYNNIGNIYERLGEYDKAEDAYMQGMKILKGIGDKRLIYNVQGNLGVIKLRKQEYKKALVHLEPVLEGFKSIKHGIGEALTLVQLGHAYMGLGQYAKAMGYYTKVLKKVKDSEFKSVEAEVYVGLGNLYLNLEGYDDAVKHYEKAMEVLKSINNFSGICELYIDFANVHQAMGDHNKALEMVEIGLKIAEEKALKLELKKLKAKRDELEELKSMVA